MKLRTTAFAVLLLTCTAALTACKPVGPRVLIFGDSLTIEAKGSGRAGEVLAGYRVDWSGTKYMTSPCNGLAVARKLTYVPDVVVIDYAGNRGSFQDNCMAGETGAALAARYVKDVQALIDRFRNGRTKVVVVGAPARQPALADGNLVFDALAALATAPGNAVAFFDGGRYLTPDRTLPTRAATCLPSETGARCGTSKDPKKDYIRDVARDHLCPLGGEIDGSCAVYSSGAYRLSLNLRDAIRSAKVPAAR